MPKHPARYAVTYGLRGCYMPDSHAGAYECHTRRELANMIRSQLEQYDIPASRFAQVRIKSLWRHIARHGSSVAHFSLDAGADAPDSCLEFHGLTEAEYTEQIAAES